MEQLQHDYYFWNLIYDYVMNRGYRVLDQGEHEVWLEDERQKPRTVIRFIRADVDWANAIRRDQQITLKRFEFVRKQFRMKQLIGENVYVTMQAPIDSWEDVKKPVVIQNKLTMYTSIIQRKDVLEQIPNRNLPLLEITDLETVEQLEQMIKQRKQAIRNEMMKKRQEEASLFKKGKPYATYALLCSIILMFILLELGGGSTSILTLIDYGAKYNPAIIDGEWWRLFTAMFLHIGILHVIMNSLALFYIGSAVERMYGTSRFLLIYFIAGLFGSLASFAFNDSISAGASGAIFGCFGALLYFGTVYKSLFFRTIGKNVLFVLVLNILFGLSVPMIDNGAHIGGLIGGFFAAAFVKLPSEKRSIKQVGAFILSIAAVAGLFFYGMEKEDGELTAMMSLQIGQEYIEREDFAKAFPYVEKAVKRDPLIPEGLFMLGYIEAIEENYAEARKHFEKAVELRPEFHEAYYNLSIIYYELGEIAKGDAALERARQLNPDYEKYEQSYEETESKTE